VPGIPDLCQYCPVERGSRAALPLSVSFILPADLSFSRPVGILHKGRPTYRCTACTRAGSEFISGIAKTSASGRPPFSRRDYSLKTASHSSARLDIMFKIRWTCRYSFCYLGLKYYKGFLGFLGRNYVLRFISYLLAH